SLEEIQLELEKQKQPSKEETQWLHQLEAWRDALIDGVDGVYDELSIDYPHLDRQYVRQLSRNAALEKARNKPPKSYRALFQYLKELTTTADTDHV
ncbi:MAG: ribosome biogenesis factor YjgA, partial [Pseudomonadota bacterium]